MLPEAKRIECRGWWKLSDGSSKKTGNAEIAVARISQHAEEKLTRTYPSFRTEARSVVFAYKMPRARPNSARRMRSAHAWPSVLRSRLPLSATGALCALLHKRRPQMSATDGPPLSYKATVLLRGRRDMVQAEVPIPRPLL
jgi:hypothetical protein